MVLTAKLNLKSVHCDITATFLHAELPEGEHIYVHQPCGFKRHPNHVLKLQHTLYGLKQAPQYFFKHLTNCLELAGYKQSQFDPCLFHANGSIIIFYVDDLLIYGRTDNDINTIISSVNELGITLNREGTAEGFLSINIHREGNKTTLSQPGLTKRIIEELGLCSKNSTPTQVPAERSPLARNTSAPAYEGPIAYGTIIGMLLYLTGHSRPDIAFAVHQCARYTLNQRTLT